MILVDIKDNNNKKATTVTDGAAAADCDDSRNKMTTTTTMTVITTRAQHRPTERTNDSRTEHSRVDDLKLESNCIKYLWAFGGLKNIPPPYRWIHSFPPLLTTHSYHLVLLLHRYSLFLMFLFSGFSTDF